MDMDIKFSSGDIQSAIDSINTCLTNLGTEQGNAKLATDKVLTNVGGELNAKLQTLFTDNTTAFNNAKAVIESFISALTTVKTEYNNVEEQIMAQINAVLGDGGGAAPPPSMTSQQSTSQFSMNSLY